MKKIFAILILSISLIGIGNAQNYWDRGNSFIFQDSLWNGYYIDTVGVDDTLSVAQASVEIPLNYDYEWLNITAIDTGATYTDSCIVEYPIYSFGLDTVARRIRTYIVTGTTWQPVQYMRDSSWTNTNLIPDNSSIKSYQVFVSDYPAIRVRMLNATIVDNRIFWFRAQANRKK